MTPSEILTFVESVNYACLVVTLPETKRKFGPGQERWQHDLAAMTPAQQDAISERVIHWEQQVMMTTSQPDDDLL